MLKKENPLARLLSILDYARDQPPNTTDLDTWRSIKNNFADEDYPVKAFINDLAALARESEAAVLNLETYDDELKAAVQAAIFEITKTLYLYPHGRTWESTREKFTDEVMLTLKMSSAALNATMEFRSIENERIEAIIDEATELEDLIRNSQINTTLKSLLLEHIEIIRISATNYLLEGIKGLRHAAEMSMGLFVFHAQEIQLIKDNDTKSILERVFGLIARTGSVANTGLKVLELAERLSPILQLGEGTPENLIPPDML